MSASWPTSTATAARMRSPTSPLTATATGSRATRYVALSSGSSFQQYTLWRANTGAGANARFVADVTGDGRADLATFTNGSGAVNSGTWHVGASSGTGFAALTTWRTGFGGNTTRQFLADTTGDGKADAVYFAAWDGSWYTTPSTGSAFGAPAAWTATHGIGSNDQFVTDGNGDGYAEPYVYFHADVTGDGVGGDLMGREYDRALKAISPENIALHTGFGVGGRRASCRATSPATATAGRRPSPSPPGSAAEHGTPSAIARPTPSPRTPGPGSPASRRSGTSRTPSAATRRTTAGTRR